MGGAVCAEESIDVVFRDAAGLISDHNVSIGEASDRLSRMNTDLWRELERVGIFRFVTARIDGKVVGYLMTMTVASMDDPNESETHATAFYVDPAYPGVGMKIQRRAIELAREKGSSRVWFCATDKGSGRRIASIYKRLGATNRGDVYALDLT